MTARNGSVAKVLARIKAAGIPVTSSPSRWPQLSRNRSKQDADYGQEHLHFGSAACGDPALRARCLFVGEGRPAPLAIPIDLAATPSDVTKLKAGDADAKDDAALAGKPKEPKPQAVKEATPKPPDETAALTDAKPDKPKDESRSPTPRPRRRRPSRRRPPTPSRSRPSQLPRSATSTPTELPRCSTRFPMRRMRRSRWCPTTASPRRK